MKSKKTTLQSMSTEDIFKSLMPLIDKLYNDTENGKLYWEPYKLGTEESTLDDFFYNKESFTDATYVAYYFSLDLKTFKEVKMGYTADAKTTLMYTISNKLNTDIIDINYEISNESKTYSVSGTYDISEDKFDCEGIDNVESKDTYCDNALNKIKDFIPKRKKILDNKYIMKAMKTTQKEVIID